MPHFRLETNVAQNKIPSDLPQKLCSVLSKSLGKPINVSTEKVRLVFVIFISNNKLAIILRKLWDQQIELNQYFNLLIVLCCNSNWWC